MIEQRTALLEEIQHINDGNFDIVARKVYTYQIEHNPVFSDYVLSIKGSIENAIQSPYLYLPISLFKSHKVKTGDWKEETYFSSSGTTGQQTSTHYVRSSSFYLQSCRKGWQAFYGDARSYKFLCLLPGYLERKGSSLIAMMNDFVSQSSHNSGFYLYDHEALYTELMLSKEQEVPTVLFGVTYALLDFLEQYTVDFPELLVFETGGMKGQREELLKPELHQLLKEGFNVDAIHSEYGMTELFSQAYSKGAGLFKASSAMKVFVHEITDPFQVEKSGRTGVMNIIDLHNIDTCAFIQTQDLARNYPDGSFELMGRLDQADIRGCNLMVVE